MSKKPTRDEKRTKHDLKHYDAIERALKKIAPRDEPSEYEPTDEELQ